MKSILNLKFNQSMIIKSLKLFEKNQQIKLFVIMIFQSLTAFLDLLGIVLIGILVNLFASRGTNSAIGNRIRSILEYLHLSNLQFKTQIFILGFSTISLFFLKTIISIFLNIKIYSFFANKASELATDMVGTMFQLTLIDRDKNSIQKNSNIVFNGATSISGLLGNTSVFITDFFLCLILVSGLVFVDGLTSIFVLILIFSLFLFMYLFFRRKAVNLGEIRTKTSVKSNELLYLSLINYRSIFVVGRFGNFHEKIKANLYQGAKNEARITSVPVISKYVFELATILVIFIVGLVEYSSRSQTSAATMFSIYLITISRLFPALLRIQGNLLGIKTALGATKETFEFIDKVSNLKKTLLPINPYITNHKDFVPEIRAEELVFYYENNSSFNLKVNYLKIEPGEKIGIVGKSGSGKSTLVDILLGINNPNNGKVYISNMSPRDCFTRWPGAVAYVPQQLNLVNGTLRENLAFGLPETQIPDKVFIDILREINLNEWYSKLEYGLDTQLGSGGVNLSGGELQRLGLARILVTRPKLIILDEATSALDATTESAVTKVLSSFDQTVTLIIIAHRLSTIKKFPKIIYVSEGKVSNPQSFDALREKYPEFNTQAELSGY